jgi:glycosyltransferase involved in cell wall biosynthesis
MFLRTVVVFQVTPAEQANDQSPKLTGMRSMSTPMVSVIIPSYNRHRDLRLALDALAKQTFPASRFEVVVVLDGSTDGSAEMLGHYDAPYRLRIFEQERQGASTARNYGASVATGDVLIFLDDDVEATPGLVQAHVEAHNGSDQRAVIGYYPPALAGNKTLLSLELQGWWEEIFHDMQETGHRFCYTDMLSGNFSIHRELYQRVGGFDPNLPMREDYELGMRLIQADAEFIFEPEALGLHHDQAIITKAMQRKYVEGIADVRVGRMHPELTQTLLIWRIMKYSRFPSKLLQQLVFYSPRLASWIASTAAKTLPGLEQAHMAGMWRRALYGVLGYWYWKGVIQELPTWKGIQDFVKDTARSQEQDEKNVLIIDLSRSLGRAEEILDRERPDNAVMYFGDKFVGRLPYQPGAERWRGTHLRPYLVSHFLFQLLEAFANQGMIDLPVSIHDINAFAQNNIPLRPDA